MNTAAASVMSDSAAEPPILNRMRMTSAFLRKLSLNAEKNWHQKSGAKRREVMRCVAIVDCSGGWCRGADDRGSPRHVAAEPSARTARIDLAVDDAVDAQANVPMAVSRMKLSRCGINSLLLLIGDVGAPRSICQFGRMSGGRPQIAAVHRRDGRTTSKSHSPRRLALVGDFDRRREPEIGADVRPLAVAHVVANCAVARDRAAIRWAPSISAADFIAADPHRSTRARGARLPP